MKVGLIWANPYNRNHGVAALAYSALYILSEVCEESQTKIEITIIGSSKSTKDSLSIEGRDIHFDNMMGLDYFKLSSLLKIIRSPRKYKVNRLLGFDLILDLSEGDSFTDLYGSWRYGRIINSKKLFNLLGTRQILLPQTVGPFKDDKKKRSAFQVMQKFEKVIARDNTSFEFVKSILPDEKILESIDLAFYLPYDKSSFSKERVNVGLNVSGLLWNGGYSGNNQFNLKGDYKDLINSIIGYFQGIENVDLYLVPHVVPLKKNLESDYYVSEVIKAEYPNIKIAPKFTSPIEAKSFISGLDFFMGSRMHSCIAAFSSGVPVFPLAYSRKFNGLFKESLKYEFLGDCVNEDNDELLNGIKDVFMRREELSKSIEQAHTNVIEPRLNKLKKILRQVLNNT